MNTFNKKLTCTYSEGGDFQLVPSEREGDVYTWQYRYPNISLTDTEGQPVQWIEFSSGSEPDLILSLSEPAEVMREWRVVVQKGIHTYTSQSHRLNYGFAG